MCRRWLLSLLIVLAGCVRRDGRNTDCQFPAEPNPKTLDVTHPGDVPHLRADVEFADELAIEYLDAGRWQKSADPKAPQNRNQALNTCLSSLADEIGRIHNLPPKSLLSVFGQRSLAVDTAINLPFFVLFGFAAWLIAGMILRRYPPSEGWLTTLIFFTLATLVVGVVAMAIAQQWSLLAENLRVGNGHLSYRVDRVPFERHPIPLFAACVVLFWVAAAVRYRRREPRLETPGRVLL